MLIGVPREVKNNEFRVAITPAGVHTLTSHGHQVLVQTRAGLGSAITDAQYRVLTALLAALPQRHPQLAAITGHEHVAPGRKTDPGPMFDWLRLARATSLPCILPSLR